MNERLPLEPGGESGSVVVLPDTLDGRIDVFLSRWHWRGPRDVVTKELNELIAFAKGQA